MSLNIGQRLGVLSRQSAGPIFSRDLRTQSYISPLSLLKPAPAVQSFPRRQYYGRSRPREQRRINTKIASGSLLVLTANSVAETGTTTCAMTNNNNICTRSLHYSTKQRTLETLARQLWRRTIHTQNDGSSGKSPESNRSKSKDEPKEHIKTESKEPTSLNKNLRERLPNLHHFHRPTKEELLAAATGFWSRLRVRFKWFSIRSVRPFNLDEIGTLFSWVLLGHMLWIILGTTTFFSLLIFAINTVFAQGKEIALIYSLDVTNLHLETLARWVGNYLTKSSGVKVVFESAIVPKWRNGVITFKNVFVSRRPGHGEGHVSKGSSRTAAAAAAAAAALSDTKDSETEDQEEDTNYTQFDVSIDTVNVTLSFTKWFNGKGPLRDVEVKGIRGVVDRTHVHWEDTDPDPKSYRHEHHTGDFEIDSFKMEDLLVTIYQPNNFRPFSVSIFSCDLPQLRKQWLFYDFLSANMISGSYDNSLFTIHPRQTHNFTGAQLNDHGEDGIGSSPWKKQSRIRIDGLNIDHLNRGVEGPFSWIHEGGVDIVADIMLPTDNNDGLAKVVSDFYDRVEATVTSNRYLTDVDQSHPPHLGLSLTTDENDKRFLVTDLRIHLTNVRAVVPLFNRDLSYINNALIRPIVAYINSRRTFIPVHCRLIKRLDDFDGSWTVFDSGLMDDLSAAVGHTYQC